MNITIFGATENVGKALINQCLWKKYKVIAFGRNVHEIDIEDENLSFVKAGVFDSDEIGFALKNADIVFSVLGGSNNNEDKTKSVGIKNILAQMKKHNKNRIVTIGVEGCLQFDDEKLMMELETFDKDKLPESEEHLKALRLLETSKVDYTFICPKIITMGEITGVYSINESYPIPNATINVNDIAQFMIIEAEQNKYINKKLSISN